MAAAPPDPMAAREADLAQELASIAAVDGFARTASSAVLAAIEGLPRPMHWRLPRASNYLPVSRGFRLAYDYFRHPQGPQPFPWAYFVPTIYRHLPSIMAHLEVLKRRVGDIQHRLEGDLGNFQQLQAKIASEIIMGDGSHPPPPAAFFEVSDDLLAANEEVAPQLKITMDHLRALRNRLRFVHSIDEGTALGNPELDITPACTCSKLH